MSYYFNDNAYDRNAQRVQELEADLEALRDIYQLAVTENTQNLQKRTETEQYITKLEEEVQWVRDTLAYALLGLELGNNALTHLDELAQYYKASAEQEQEVSNHVATELTKVPRFLRRLFGVTL